MWAGVDWLLPPRCGGCGEPGARWCLKCQSEVVKITPPICEVCGSSQRSEGICPRCTAMPPLYTALRSWAGFSGPLRNAIHRLKYDRDMALGETLARPLIDCLTDTHWQIDLVVPVPIGPSRRNERGYNQAALLARPVALYHGLAYRPRVLRKKRDTHSQVGLTIEQRRANVRDAFIAEEKDVRETHVLLVDDVSTSGATLNACAQALVEAGAKNIYCLTLARAL